MAGEPAQAVKIEVADAAERARLARETDAALASVRSEADRLARVVEARLEGSWKQ